MLVKYIRKVTYGNFKWCRVFFELLSGKRDFKIAMARKVISCIIFVSIASLGMFMFIYGYSSNYFSASKGLALMLYYFLATPIISWYLVAWVEYGEARERVSTKTLITITWCECRKLWYVWAVVIGQRQAC